MPPPNQKPAKPAKGAARRERLAAELRANLKKRKARERALAGAAATAGGEAPAKPNEDADPA
jgi:hypothetical protein